MNTLWFHSCTAYLSIKIIDSHVSHAGSFQRQLLPSILVVHCKWCRWRAKIMRRSVINDCFCTAQWHKKHMSRQVTLSVDVNTASAVWFWNRLHLVGRQTSLYKWQRKSTFFFYFRRRTAGYKSVFGRSCDRPPRHRFFLVSLCL